VPEVGLRSQPSFFAMRSSERLCKLSQNSAVVPEEMGHEEAVSHLIPCPDVVPDFRTLEHFPAYVIHHTNRTRAASQGSSTPELACTSGNFSFRTDSGKPVAWPKDECISVTAPDLNARHRVVLLCDGERQQCELNRLLVSSFIA